MLISRRKLTVKVSTADFLSEVEKNFTILPINAAIAERSMTFSDQYPKDPTDRIIGATAIVYGLKLITSDGLILASKEVDCIW